MIEGIYYVRSQNFLDERNKEQSILNYRKYQNLESAKLITQCCISKNELYLAYSNIDRELIIYVVSQTIPIKQLKFKQLITICKFSLQDKYLCTGSQTGYLYFLKVKSDFSQCLTFVIDKLSISHLQFCSQNQFLICSQDYAIRLFDINNKMLLKIQRAHNYTIHGLDYDHINNVIISCSGDTSINFFNRFNGKKILQKQFAHDNTIFQIQHIQNQKLLSRSYRDLILWQIDYNNHQLIKLQTIELSFNMFNFNSQHYGNIVVICDMELFVLDKNLKIIQTINDLEYSYIWPLCSENFIAIKQEYVIELHKFEPKIKTDL